MLFWDHPSFQVDVKKLMKQLDREKIDLEGQLKDLEWRLNNESRVSSLSNDFFCRQLTTKP